jgi:hypothetical protein
LRDTIEKERSKGTSPELFHEVEQSPWVADIPSCQAALVPIPGVIIIDQRLEVFVARPEHHVGRHLRVQRIIQEIPCETANQRHGIRRRTLNHYSEGSEPVRSVTVDVVEAEGDGEGEAIGVAAVPAAGPDLP